ncbi:hypothetical protein JP0186_08160 [Helicobacter pylori]
MKAPILSAFIKRLRADYLLGLSRRLDPLKRLFVKDFTEKEQKALIYAYKSGFKASQLDKVAQYWQNKPTKIDLHKPIKTKDFFKGNTNIYRTLHNLFGQKFMDRYTALDSKATMKDFMSSDKFVKKYRYTQKDKNKI